MLQKYTCFYLDLITYIFSVQRAVHDIENKHVSKSEAGSASNFGTTISTVHSLDQETEQHIEDIDNSRSTQIEIPAKDSRLLQTLQMVIFVHK